jgi:predicted ATPase
MPNRPTQPASQLFITGVSLIRRPGDAARGYPWSIPAIRNLETLPFPTPVTFFVGENGSGKSTLLEAIAAAFGLNPEGGTKYVRFSTRSSHSTLFKELRLTRTRPAPTDSYFLRAETFYNVATVTENPEDYRAYDPDASGGRSFHDQSHGEAFLALVLNRFRGNGFYALDEPEAALSPSRQLSLLAAMHRLVERRSQFVIATHSPILLGFPGATIYLFGDHPPAPIAYRETEHYQLTRAFLEHPERMLRELCRDDDERDAI